MLKELRESASGAWQLGFTIALGAAPLDLSTQSRVYLKKLAKPESRVEVSRRPDLIFFLKQIAVLLGVFKLDNMPAAISDLLVYSTGVHSADFYGGVPYILACAASGSEIEFFVIYPTGVRAPVGVLSFWLVVENIFHHSNFSILSLLMQRMTSIAFCREWSPSLGPSIFGNPGPAWICSVA